MARRRRVSFPTMTDSVRTVSFFYKGKGIAVPKRKPELCFSNGKAQFPLTIQGQKDWIIHVKKERAKLKREIVKEVARTLIKELEEPDHYSGTADFWDETKKQMHKAARLAIDLWEKRK